MATTRKAGTGRVSSSRGCDGGRRKEERAACCGDFAARPFVWGGEEGRRPRRRHAVAAPLGEGARERRMGQQGSSKAGGEWELKLGSSHLRNI